MSTCPGCGGVVGRDCWNPQECEWISRDMEARRAAEAYAREADRQAIREAVADERERIAQAIEAERNRHWQRHLTEHPYADSTSCPEDYGKHDAFAVAARYARSGGTDTAGGES